ncbi:MAG TPA: DUF3566 domain-containing protein [Methanobacteriaceae archaeon]|nr:DUF3566 domain-containing protein [Methanobacteriaceae archaeon]
MNSSVSAVWSFIYAIFTLILALLGFVVSPDPVAGVMIGVYTAMIIASPVLSFIIGIGQSFLTALLYNLFVPRIGGIKLGIVELSEIRTIPVVPFALMTSAISAVITLLIALIIVPLFAVYAGVFMQVLSSIPQSNATASIPTTGLGAMGVIGSIILIIAAPIVVFVLAFIMDAILAVIYNIIAPRVGGIKLEFEALGEGIYEILKIPPIPLALLIGCISAVIGLIIGLLVLVITALSGSVIIGVIILIAFIIGGFIAGFLIYAILALIYNFLRPKIGGVKIELD